jgi:hypothetical protein
VKPIVRCRSRPRKNAGTGWQYVRHRSDKRHFAALARVKEDNLMKLHNLVAGGGGIFENARRRILAARQQVNQQFPKHIRHP